MKKFVLLFVCLALSIGVWAQTTITGVVSDEEGVPLIGATIMEKGTFNGTISDVDGSYSITCNSSAPTLVISLIGFTTNEVVLDGNSTTLNVSLKEGVLELTGVEVIGTRNINRSATETPVAIDIIPIDKITADVGQLDINQMLQYVAPSFNANRQSGSDGSDHIDPATLRGLGPDQTLVLINGKRRHQSSLVNLYGTRGRGNTGTDLNTIPMAAIERIEILRDGAAAQYGSDAIAGVINIVLKEKVDEFTGNLNGGVTTEGDGENVNVNGNYGFGIGDGGFVNVTLDYNKRGKTNREIDATQYAVYRRQFGDASSNNFSAVFNSSMPLRNGASVYAFGSLNSRFGDAFAWTRYPESARNVLNIYPDGFDPHIQSVIDDKATTVGIKGKVRGWNTDFSNTYGSNRFHYYVDGTLNASLGSASPTRFDAGGFMQQQNTTGLTFSRNFDVAQGLSVAFGTEYRVENYSIFAGEEASWRTYGPVLFSADSIFNDQGVFEGIDSTYRPGGAQGFPGFRPENELNEWRSNLGGYIDLEIDPIKNLTLAAAGRYERYSDFGDTWNGKFAARYAINPKFALRASVSTGFRAPSLAQRYFNSTYTNVIGGNILDVFLAKNNSPVTRALGIDPLRQETAVNSSFGVTLKPFEGFTATIDGYTANIKDRIVLTGTFYDDDEQIGDILRSVGVSGAQFFANALDTKTIGLDVILTYGRRFGNHRIGATFAGNFNKMELGDLNLPTKLDGKEDAFFGEREKKFLLASAPPSKLALTLDYYLKRFNANVRIIRFDKVVLRDWIDTDDTYNAKFTTDLTLGYDITNNLSFVVGASNLLNVYPDIQDTETESGGNYDAVQMGSNGTFVFTKLGFKF